MSLYFRYLEGLVVPAINYMLKTIDCAFVKINICSLAKSKPILTDIQSNPDAILDKLL